MLKHTVVVCFCNMSGNNTSATASADSASRIDQLEAENWNLKAAIAAMNSK